jgi:hypothetical protein
LRRPDDPPAAPGHDQGGPNWPNRPPNCRRHRRNPLEITVRHGQIGAYLGGQQAVEIVAAPDRPAPPDQGQARRPAAAGQAAAGERADDRRLGGSTRPRPGTCDPGLARDAETPAGFRLVAVAGRQHGKDVALFDGPGFLETTQRARALSWLPVPGRSRTSRESASVRPGCAIREHCPASRKRPSGPKCGIERERGTPRWAPAGLMKCSTSSGMSSGRSRSGGKRDLQHLQAVIEILAEALGGDFGFQVAIGGGDDPHIDRNFLLRTNRPDAPLLKHTQQLGLGGQRHFAEISSRNSVPPRA